MDPLKRGPNGLRRFFRAHARLLPDNPSRPGGAIREKAAPSGETSVRALLERTVATFVPPQLPLADANVSCSRAIAVLTHIPGSIGGLQIVADVSTHLPPGQTVMFFIGFATNVEQYWVSMAGALNWKQDTPGVLDDGPEGVFWGYGDSAWLGRDFAKAREHGVTFRIHSTTHMRANPKDVLREWMRKFDRPLGPPMSKYDLGPDAWPKQPELDRAKEGGDGDNEKLSFTVRLVFE